MVIALAFINGIILFIAIKTNFILYTITPKKQWKPETDKFDANYKKLLELDITNNDKISNDHLY